MTKTTEKLFPYIHLLEAKGAKFEAWFYHWAGNGLKDQEEKKDMSEDKIKAMFVMVTALLLVVSAGIPVAIGTQDDAETDVTVDVEFVCPTIELIDYPEDTVNYTDDIYVEAIVTTPGQDNAVEDVKFDFESEHYCHINKSSDAVTKVTKENLGINWSYGDDGAEGKVNHTFDLDNLDGDMWQAGEWTLITTVYCTGDCGDSHCSDTSSTMIYVEEHLEINWADNAEASDEPGQDLGPEQFENTDGEHPKLEITANTHWELEEPKNITLTHQEGDEIELNVTYNQPEADEDRYPMWEETIKINYSGEIPYGAMDGDYLGTATHSLVSIPCPGC